MAGLTNENEERLLYHPDIRRIREEINSPDYKLPTKTEQVSVIIESLSSDVWIDMYDILAEINALIATIEGRYMNSPAGDSDLHSFKTYKSALADSTNASQEIVDRYEAYQMDYRGRIDIEVYPILLELRYEWEQNLIFFKASCLMQTDRNVPEVLTTGSTSFTNLKNQELADINSLYSKYQEQDALESQLRNRILINKDTYIKVVNETAYLQDKMDTKTEAVANMRAKLEIGKAIVSRLKSIINIIAVDGTFLKQNALATFSNIKFSSSDYDLIALNCKLSIDGLIKDLQKSEEERKSISSTEIRDKIHEDLIYITHIHNEATKPLSRSINNLTEVPTHAGTLLSIIADGLERSSAAYKLTLNSSYVLDENDKNILDSKLNILIEKNDSRYYYRSVIGITDYIEDKGVFPGYSELDSILKNAL